MRSVQNAAELIAVTRDVVIAMNSGNAQRGLQVWNQKTAFWRRSHERDWPDFPTELMTYLDLYLRSQAYEPRWIEILHNKKLPPRQIRQAN